MSHDFRATAVPSADEMTSPLPYLFGATPHGVASGQVETLTSFACRIGERRSMRPATVIGSLVQRFARRNNFNLRVQKQNAQVNGAGLTAQRTVDAFDQALAVNVSEHLTLLPWAELIEGRMHGLLRPYVAYCPECIARDHLVSDTHYIRLLWTLQVVESCPIHNIRLYDACVTCGERLPTIPWLSNPLFCMKCRRDVSRARSTRFQGRPTDFSQWISAELAKLLALTNGGSHSIGCGELAASLRRIVEQEFGDNVIKFAHYFELGIASCRIYCRGDGKPTFPALCRILYQLKLSPVDLWITGNNTLDINKRSKLARTTTEIAGRRRLSGKKKTRIQKDLNKLLGSDGEVVGPAEFARRYNTTNHVVRYHFADLYSRHRALYDWQEKAKRLEIRQQRIQRVRDAAETLVSKGIYPSQRKLKETGQVCASDLTRTDVRLALRPILGAYEKRALKEDLREKADQ